MLTASRRQFLCQGAALATAAMGPSVWPTSRSEALVFQDPTVQIAFPRARVPLTFIIDDSTCLVNMGHFGMPQFQACYPERAEYQKRWSSFPREIPDQFVREFGEWCAGQGVKGKYSLVPYPACVGWLDRDLPGWSRRALQDSLELVRTLIVPNWDLHPEMITHTRVIDLKTGRPLEQISPATMENSFPQEQRSADELAEYLAYALRILRNCGLSCEGVTTPGGFGNRVKPELSLAVQQAVRDVFHVPVPHFFKYVVEGHESTEPRLEHVSGLGTEEVSLTVNIPSGTGDWFGGWDGDGTPEPDRYCTADATSGRLVELIERGQPASFLCHWPGLYSQGAKTGFRAFQRVVQSIHDRYRDRVQWMKLSEMAVYWAAKGLTAVHRAGETLTLEAPFACPDFTLTVPALCPAAPRLRRPDGMVALTEVRELRRLGTDTWHFDGRLMTLCFSLPRGLTTVSLQ